MDVHAGHAQNANNSHLGILTHMQLAHDEYRQKAHSKVRQRRNGTVDVGHCNDNLDADAGALDIRVHGSARPEVLERLALQQHDEHEEQARQHGEGHDGREDPDMQALDGDAHQKDADGDFASDGREAVGDFTQPPVLCLLVLFP